MKKMRGIKVNSFLVSIVSVLLSLVIAGIIIKFAGKSPIAAYGSLLNGAFGSARSIANTLAKATPLMFVGLSCALAAHAGLINIGGEGQLYIGALFAVIVPLTLEGTPPVIVIPLSFIMAMAGGALAGAVPGFFKARYGINEVIVAIMLNYIAELFTSYLVSGPMRGDAWVAQSAQIAPQYRLSILLKNSSLSTAIIIALVVAGMLYFFLWKTKKGFELRCVGSNHFAAEAVGIRPRRFIFLAMCSSGALAGLTGAAEVLGSYGRFIDGFSPGFGFTALAVAVLGRNRPLGTIVTAILFGALSAGSVTMSRKEGISTDISLLIQGLVILFVAAPRIVESLLDRFETSSFGGGDKKLNDSMKGRRT